MDPSIAPKSAAITSPSIQDELPRRIGRTATIEFTDSQATVEAQHKSKLAVYYEENVQTSTSSIREEIAKASKIDRNLRDSLRINRDIKATDLDISYEVVIQYCNQTKEQALAKQTERSPFFQKINRVTKCFCETATRMHAFLDVVVPSSPEYSIPYGFLMVLFKAVVDREQEREKVAGLLEELAECLPDASLYLELYHTSRIKLLCAILQTQVLGMLELLIEYCGLGRLSQLGNAIFQRKKFAFDNHMDVITGTKQALKRCAEQAAMAKREDRDLRTEMLQEHSIATGKLMLRHYELSKKVAEATAVDIDGLDKRMSDMQKQMNGFINAQVSHRAYTLLNIFLPHTPPLEQELALWHSISFQISQKEQWENTDLLEYLSEWSQNNMNTILLVSGKCKDRHPWVTRFSVDLMALLHNKKRTLAVAFCDRPPGEKSWDMQQLVKILSYRLLEHNTRLLLEAPHKFNARSLQASQSTESDWILLESIIGLLDVVYLVIDRLECCEQNEEGTMGYEFLKSLSKIVLRYPGKLHVIVTTIEEPAIDSWGVETSRAISVAHVRT